MGSITVNHLCKQFWIGQSGCNTGIREAMVNLLRRAAGARPNEKVSIWALDDISFKIARGEIVGIVGANGAGKSTLLKILSRITYPTRGSIHTRGRVASLLEVGTGFHEELTGRENIYLNGSILGMKKAEIRQRFDAIVEFSGVGTFLDTPLKRYSSGMRLRLGFAVAAHLDPDILLIDEVLAVGDVGFQKKCIQAVNDLRNGGRTVLFVSHDMAAVENLCPRAIWIDGGKIRMDGPAIEVITSYVSTFAGAGRRDSDLTQINHRRGSGDIRLTKIEFLEGDGAARKIIRAGDDLKIRLHYQAVKRVRNPLFGIEIYTELGTLVSELSTWTTGLDIPSLSAGSGHLDLDIEFLNLMPGRYYFTLWSGNLGPVYHDVLDKCGCFDVEPSDFYNSGKGVDSRFGVVFFQCGWTCNQAPPTGILSGGQKGGGRCESR